MPHQPKRPRLTRKKSVGHRTHIPPSCSMDSITDPASLAVDEEVSFNKPWFTGSAKSFISNVSHMINDILTVRKSATPDAFLFQYIYYALETLTRPQRDPPLAKHPEIRNFAVMLHHIGGTGVYHRIRGDGYDASGTRWIGNLVLPSERTVRRTFDHAIAVPGVDIAQIDALIERCKGIQNPVGYICFDEISPAKSVELDNNHVFRGFVDVGDVSVIKDSLSTAITLESLKLSNPPLVTPLNSAGTEAPQSSPTLISTPDRSNNPQNLTPVHKSPESILAAPHTPILTKKRPAVRSPFSSAPILQTPSPASLPTYNENSENFTTVKPVPTLSNRSKALKTPPQKLSTTPKVAAKLSPQAAAFKTGIEEMELQSVSPAAFILQAMWVSFDKQIVQPIGFLILNNVSGAVATSFLASLIVTIETRSSQRIKTLALVSDSSPHAKNVSTNFSIPSTPGVGHVLGPNLGPKIAILHDSSHLLKNFRNYLHNATALQPLKIAYPSDRSVSIVHWGVLAALYHKANLSCRLTSAHVYLTNRTKMRTSLASFLFKPMFVEEVAQDGSWSALVKFLRIGEAVQSCLRSRASVTSIACLQPLEKVVEAISWSADNIQNSIPTHFVNALEKTLNGLKWLIPTLLDLGVSFTLYDISSDAAENWFSRVRSHQGINASVSIKEYMSMYPRLQLLTNGGEKYIRTSYDDTTCFNVKLESLDVYAGRTRPSYENFVSMLPLLNLQLPTLATVKIKKFTVDFSDAQLKRYGRIAGWMIQRALTCGRFSDLNDILEALISTKEKAITVPVYGLLLWTAKVDISTQKCLITERLLHKYGSIAHWVQTYLMRSTIEFSDDFLLMIAQTMDKKHSNWRTKFARQRLYALASFFIGLLSLSITKDSLIHFDIQRKRGGSNSFRSALCKTTENKPKGEAHAQYLKWLAGIQPAETTPDPPEDDFDQWSGPKNFELPSNLYYNDNGESSSPFIRLEMDEDDGYLFLANVI